MTYTEHGDTVQIEMTRSEYDGLLIILGYASGAASKQDQPFFRRMLAFVNELNRTNPSFIPYVIPPEMLDHI